MLRAVILTLALFVIVPSARANFISFDIHYTFSNCFFCSPEDSNFTADTGLSAPSDFPVDVSARFTIDTSLDDGSGFYVFDSPGTGISVTVGLLTLLFDEFRLIINTGFLGGTCSEIIVTAGEVLGPGAAFTMTDCASAVPGALVDASLATFVHADLSQFGPGVGDPSVGDGSWLLFGQGQTTAPVITRVPEPCSLALLGIGLAGIGFVRRKKRA